MPHNKKKTIILTKTNDIYNARIETSNIITTHIYHVLNATYTVSSISCWYTNIQSESIFNRANIVKQPVKAWSAELAEHWNTFRDGASCRSIFLREGKLL